MGTFWKKDWFAGLIVTVIFLFLTNSQLIEKLEFANYDFAMNQLARDPQQNIAVIAIDDQSIENLGRWPWPRSLQAEMIEKLAQAGANVIGNSILLSEAQTHTGGSYIDQALQSLESKSDPNLNDVINILKEGQAELDTDGKLANAMQQAGNVVMGMQFQLGRPLGKPDEPLPDFVARNAFKQNPNEGGVFIYPAISATPPISVLGETALAIGHLNMWLDSDGGIRSDLLAVDYYGEIIPSLAAMIAASSLNLSSEDFKITNRKFNLGNLSISLDEIGRIYPFFYENSQGQTPFSVDSFYDVHVGKIDINKYKDRIVLIGASAFGVGTSVVTPVAESMPPVLVLANIVASILNQDFIEKPDWAGLIELLAFVLIAVYLMLLLPRLKAGMAAAISFACLVLLIVTSQFLLYSGIWLQLMLPTALLLTGYILLISKRYLVTEKGKILSDQASADSNRTLGLSYQQQGQLDMALDKFRKCPLDDSMMEPLYNLALDFERKRQFNKASSVYEYMVKHDPNFKDVQQRIKKSNAMQDTFMFGAAGASAGASLINEDGSVEKPMLGRYQVEKELGKGAMGIVYLGKDPRINRIVAIKTMALSQEFEDDELTEVKDRFFREAETAGRLTHPNIVTVYDVGEEHDLAYIAMEYLEGHDLGRYTKKDKLLPIKTAIQLTILAAEALHYAHQNNVVHRDIKPANVMLLPKSSTIKLTDFGIARITDSSKTKTGMVLGTPSYMSPEQLVGKHIDGRSDLFSLGVMLFQLLTGRLPFDGDSMSSLMYNIANEPHPEIIQFREELKQVEMIICAIIDGLLDKSQENRYQTGEELAKDLRNCLKSLKK